MGVAAPLAAGVAFTAPLAAAYAIWFAWGLSWLVAGLWRARAVARAPGGATRKWLFVALLGFAGLFALPPGRLRPLYAAPLAVQWALVLLVAAGAAFAWVARVHLGALWSGGITAREGHRVVASGPYAIVRHPIYTGLFAAVIGLAALEATPLALAGAALVIVAFTGKARLEEHFLGETLGVEAYAAYRARVPMLVPFGGGLS